MKQHNRKIIYILGFLYSVPVALTSYINSSFLENFFSTNYISIIYIMASLLTILGMIKMPKMLSYFGNRETATILSLSIFSSFLVLALSNNPEFIIGAFVVNFIAVNLIITCLDVFIEDFSKINAIGSFRGFYLMIINLAWIVAQLISSTIISRSSFAGIYLISALIMLVVSIILIFSLRNFADPKYKQMSFVNGVKFFTKNINLLKIYLINLILKFFFAWMIIYTPIYLHEYLKFDWSQIGIIFTIMLVPFLGQFSLGKLSDKIGEKKMLKLGFIISAVSTLCIPLITTNTLFLMAGILFMTRVGAAMIEVMSENYFFKSVPEENVEALSFFRNTAPISFIIAPLLAIPVFFFIPSSQYIFYVLGTIMLAGFFITLRLKDVR